MIAGRALSLCIAFAGCIVTRAPAEGAAPWPFMVGANAHGAENIEALAALGIGNFMWVPASVYDTSNVPFDDEHTVLHDVQACVDNGLYFMVSHRRGLGDTLRPGGYEYGGHADEFLEPDTVREIIGCGGDQFVGLHAEELDADFIQNAIRPSFRTRSPQLYRFTDRAGGRAALEAELARLRDRSHQLGAPFIANMCVTMHHSGFRVGADLVIAELLEHLPTTELQLAYLRGGARQFSSDFGVWVSPWWIGEIPCEDKDLWPKSHASLTGGHSAESLRRCLLLSYVSGARLLCTQDTPPVLARDADGNYRLAAWGRELAAFWAYAREHQEPLRPTTPLAIVVDKDNGWSPPHLWINWTLEDTIWGKLPINRADRMLTGYLDVLLPGFHRTHESVEDRTDIYPGYFASTPHGPFDILSSDVSPDALAAYDSVALLGEVDMTEELLESLRRYVEGGGTLLVNVLHMRSGETWRQDDDLLGLRLGNGAWTRLYASSEIVAEPPLSPTMPSRYAEPWFAGIQVQLGSARTLATDGEGHPVLLENVFGKGRVLVSTPEYMQEGWGEQSATLGFFRDVLTDLCDTGDVSVTEGRDISWVSAVQGAGSIIIALANHGPDPQTVRVSVTGATEAVLDFSRGEASLERGQQPGSAVVTIPGRDAVLIRMEGVSR